MINREVDNRHRSGRVNRAAKQKLSDHVCTREGRGEQKCSLGLFVNDVCPGTICELLLMFLIPSIQNVAVS